MVKQTVLPQFDLAAFKLQKEAITKAASSEIAARLNQVEVLLREVQEIAKAAEVQVAIDNVYELVGNINSNHNWNSSSYNC